MFGGLFRFGASGVSLDNPQYRLDDPRAVSLFLDGSAGAASGIRVTADTAHTCSPWYRGVNLFSDLVAKLPLGVFAKLPEGGKRALPEHDWSRTLATKFGPWWTPFVAKKYLVASMLIEGNGYAYIDRDAFELRPIDPRTITPVIEQNDDEIERLFYVLHAGTTKPRKYHADEVLHFKVLSRDGISGLSIVALAREAIGLSLGAQRYQAVSLKNNARPGVVLKFPGKLRKETRETIREQWERMNTAGGAGRTAVLDQGMTIETLGFTAEEVQLIQTREFSIVDIANFIGLPPHKLGDRARQGYNGLEQENLSMLGDSLDPCLVNMEQEYQDKLLTEEEKVRGDIEIIHDREKLVATDMATKANFWRVALGGHPFGKISEARASFQWNHEDGTDVIPAPTNMGHMGDPPAEPGGPAQPKPQPKPPGNAALVEATGAGLIRAAERVSRRIANQARSRVGKPATLVAWIDTLPDEAAAVAAELVELERAADLARGRESGSSFGAALLAAHHAALDKMVATTAAANLATALDALQLVGLTTQLATDWLSEGK